MTTEPPLGMDPDQRNVWDSGAESYRRGLPITTDHPYCCAMKDVWEAGWKAASASKKAAHTTEQRTEERMAFEDWIGGPPYERDLDRWPAGGTENAWPGQYKDNTVQIAWEAWNERPWHL